MRFLRPSVFSLGLTAFILIVGLIGGWSLGRSLPAFGESGETHIDQSAVVDRLRAVAKLVSTEARVRDVIEYQNTWLGSTKRMLVIATGNVLIGFDLNPPPTIRIDETTRRITIHLPAPRVLGIDVVELKTYDEKQGLWNPFQPADRDTVFQLAREHLNTAANDMGMLAHAEESATHLLQSLFAPDGYTVEVSFSSSQKAPAF
jgi:hypothetical protein